MDPTQEPMDLSNYFWIVIAGAVAAFVMAYGIGANDVANAFATSVGARSLKLWQAVVIASFTEFAGAVLMGSAVTSTIRKGIVDVDLFNNHPDFLMIGMLSSIIGAAIWLLVATKFSLPVSTTHSIVGGILGFSLVVGGVNAINWTTVGLIIASWFVSPILSGIVSLIIYLFVRYFVLRSENSYKRGLLFLPFLFGITIGVNVFFLIYKGLPGIGGDDLPIGYGVLISVGSGLVCIVLSHFLGVPLIKWMVNRRFEKDEKKKDIEMQMSGIAEEKSDEKQEPNEEKEEKKENKEKEEAKVSQDAEKGKESGEKTESDPPGYVSPTMTPASSTDAINEKNRKKWNSKEVRKQMSGDALIERGLKNKRVNKIHSQAEVFDDKTETLFMQLQVFTAIFDSYAHGANDVANAVAPLAAIVAVYNTGVIDKSSVVPIWILALGGAGIVVGLATLGHYIIEAIGVNLTKITPSRGFAIELGAAFIIVTGSMLGLPLSTTHCQVGSTAAVGWAEGKHGVNLWILFQTFVAWIVTLIFAGGISAALYSFAVFSPHYWP